MTPRPHPDSEPCPNGPCAACSGTGWVGPNYRANRGLPPMASIPATHAETPAAALRALAAALNRRQEKP